MGETNHNDATIWWSIHSFMVGYVIFGLKNGDTLGLYNQMRNKGYILGPAPSSSSTMVLHLKTYAKKTTWNEAQKWSAKMAAVYSPVFFLFGLVQTPSSPCATSPRHPRCAPTPPHSFAKKNTDGEFVWWWRYLCLQRFFSFGGSQASQLRLPQSSHVWSLWQGPKGKVAGALAWREPKWRRKARAWWKWHWRAQMKGLKDFFFPDIEMQTEPAVSQDWGHKIYGSVCHKDRLRFS